MADWHEDEEAPVGQPAGQSRRPKPTTPNPVRFESRGRTIRDATKWLRSLVAGYGTSDRSPQLSAGLDIITRLEQRAAELDREDESEVVIFQDAMRKADAVVAHYEAVLSLAIPDTDARATFWRQYWTTLAEEDLR